MSKDDLGKWMCAKSEYEEYWNAYERYDTKEEAVEAGTKVIKELQKNWNLLDLQDRSIADADTLGYTYDNSEDEIPTSFVVGQIHRDWTPSIDTDVLLEWINEDAYNNCGEFAENYLDNLPRKQVDELNEQLNNVLNAWIDKYDNHPGFFTIYFVDEVEVPL